MVILRVGGSGSPLAVEATDLQVVGRCLRVNHKYMWVAWRLSKIARCGWRVARCELRLPNVEGLGSSLVYAYGVSMAYLCNSFVLSGIGFIFGMVLFRIIDISHIPQCYGN